MRTSKRMKREQGDKRDGGGRHIAANIVRDSQGKSKHSRTVSAIRGGDSTFGNDGWDRVMRNVGAV